MNYPSIKKSTVSFLKDLAANDNREWFASHSNEYALAKEDVEHFIDALIYKMNEHDELETPSGKKSLYRIYNDVRFSKDKTPFSARFSGYLRRNKPFLRGGYYFWIAPGNSAIGCGFGNPNAHDLKRIRQDIDINYKEWRKLLRSKNLVATFGHMQGKKVNTAPRSFLVDHPAIDLLRFKQFWFHRTFTDKEVLDEDFLLVVNKSFKAIRPFFNYMSGLLTTDLNGEPL